MVAAAAVFLDEWWGQTDAHTGEVWLVQKAYQNRVVYVWYHAGEVQTEPWCWVMSCSSRMASILSCSLWDSLALSLMWAPPVCTVKDLSSSAQKDIWSTREDSSSEEVMKTWCNCHHHFQGMQRGYAYFQHFHLCFKMYQSKRYDLLRAVPVWKTWGGRSEGNIFNPPINAFQLILTPLIHLKNIWMTILLHFKFHANTHFWLPLKKWYVVKVALTLHLDEKIQFLTPPTPSDKVLQIHLLSAIWSVYFNFNVFDFIKTNHQFFIKMLILLLPLFIEPCGELGMLSFNIAWCLPCLENDWALFTCNILPSSHLYRFGFWSEYTNSFWKHMKARKKYINWQEKCKFLLNFLKCKPKF